MKKFPGTSGVVSHVGGYCHTKRLCLTGFPIRAYFSEFFYSFDIKFTTHKRLNMTLEIKDLVGLSKPLERLIEVTSAGIGRVTKAHFSKKDAEAKAYEIRLLSEAIGASRNLVNEAGYDDGKVKLSGVELPAHLSIAADAELVSRALGQQTFKAITQQLNAEAIVSNAAAELTHDESVPDDKPEPEWTSRFFRIAEDIPTEELQFLWGKILAGEIRKPGSFSLRTLELLRNLSKKEAEAFVALTPYIIHAGENYFYLRDSEYIIGKDGKLSFGEILKLKEAGLVNSDSMLGLTFGKKNAGSEAYYFNGELAIKFRFESGHSEVQMSVGMLTFAGIQLLKLVAPIADMEYVKIFSRKFNADGVSISICRIRMVDEVSFQILDETPLQLS